MESPEFKEVLNFRLRLSWLHLAYSVNKFRSGTIKADISKTLTNIFYYFKKSDYISEKMEAS